MDIIIHPGKLNGQVNAIPSKSQAHRLLICSAFSEQMTTLICPDTNQDIEATADCLCSLGADVRRTSSGYEVYPAKEIPQNAELYCRESGSTLRFLLPIVGALGVDAQFHLEGRLHQRPLSPLWEQMEEHGCILTRPSERIVRCQGKLSSGKYTIDGGVSSQFISGLLFAAALMDGNTEILLTGNVESVPYIRMTQQALTTFGVNMNDFNITGSWPFSSPGELTVEGDWSNAAFFLAANSLGNHIDVVNLNTESAQGDRTIMDLIPRLTEYVSISAANIPDLVPILSVIASAGSGATFTEIARLRLKESDRVESVIHMLQSLGGHATADHNAMDVYPSRFHGGTVETYGDHRIAMAAAIAATNCDKPVVILNADCVSKSYPRFWEDYAALGGKYEQYLW